jgi:hypothetical protein
VGQHDLDMSVESHGASVNQRLPVSHTEPIDKDSRLHAVLWLLVRVEGGREEGGTRAVMTRSISSQRELLK